MKKIFSKLMAGMAFLVFSACAAQVDDPAKFSKTVKINKLLILPFKDMSAIYGKSNSVRCPLCGRVYLTGEVPKGAADFLTEHLTGIIKSRTDFTVIPGNHINILLPDPASGDAAQKSERMLLIEAVRIAGADAVISGYVYRFKQRVGTAYAAESPASVAFGVHMINGSDGRMLWSGQIDDTQHHLSNNLFEIASFFKRGGSWVTSEELAVLGLEKIFKKFPKS
ncbi:hypothetical protein BuS5_03593 [Desulfosarcina sp. BuS5]|uniref:hypothetical protein n=1 Tax=Desulfosarcina sp. BuS5 TaxID=933262 RepID=UPI000488F160|nr:hypothetical protein [Desulfosarcina sp. BuS5]WDN90622.1 hypothetical protein BuS5_03593 [Desulfosarcina sp. BuS5]